VALLVVLSAGTASAGVSIIYPKGPDPAVSEWPHWPYPVSCGGLPFDPVAAFGGPTEAEKGTGGPEQALARYLEVAATEASISKSYWRLVAADETRVEFAEGRLEQGAAWLRFQLSGGAWKPVGTLDFCVPRTIREGSESAQWGIDGSQTLGPNTRRVKVNLSAGDGCDGGRSLDAAAERPEFRQFGKRLVMTIWLEPLPPGIYTCQKLVEPPLVVKLPGRLGDRRLFDGRTYPPRLRQ
jgi:hypothetical protein